MTVEEELEGLASDIVHQLGGIAHRELDLDPDKLIMDSDKLIHDTLGKIRDIYKKIKADLR